MEKQKARLTPVPFPAKQVREDAPLWAWTEPCVWTERMLTALQDGVKGEIWYSLIDKVYRPANLHAAFRRVKRNRGAAGIDHVTTEMFGTRLQENLTQLHEALRQGTYRPQPVRRKWIAKPGSREQRPLGIPTVRDRVVQTALRNVLEPIFERDFAEHSYGFRPGRSCKDALHRVDALLKAGYTHVVDADLKSYFDTIPHDKLLELIRQRVADQQVISLVAAFLEQGVMDGLSLWTPTNGTPQGAVISPLLSNVYLNPLDHLMAALGFEMVRYADDFVVLCRSRQDAERALALLQQWTADAGLTLHPDKTCIVDATQKGVGFDFLGYHFENGYRWPRTKSLQNLKASLRPKTKRNNGRSLPHIIQTINATLRGWFEYFKHSHPTTFAPLDKWIRRRLRSILRKRQKQRGLGRGLRDHQRWPNIFFAKHGLYTLKTAHEVASQSAFAVNH